MLFPLSCHIILFSDCYCNLDKAKQGREICGHIQVKSGWSRQHNTYREMQIKNSLSQDKSKNICMNQINKNTLLKISYLTTFESNVLKKQHINHIEQLLIFCLTPFHAIIIICNTVNYLLLLCEVQCQACLGLKNKTQVKTMKKN